MATIPLFRVEDYLSRTYRPDREYIDGVVVERNVGEYDHARLQAKLVHWFMTHEEEWKIRVVPEQRMQVAPLRYRVPDVTILAREQPIEQVFTHPPLAVIEVVSPEDSLRGYQERIADYLNFGIGHVWILDPALRKAWTAHRNQLAEATELRIPGSDIYISLPEIFEAT